MKCLKKLLIWALIMAFLLGNGMNIPDHVYAKSKKVSMVKKAKITVNAKKTIRLKNNKKKVTWKIKNKKIAKLIKKSKSRAVVKGMREGTTKLIAKIGTKKYICILVIKNKPQEEQETEDTTEDTKSKAESYQYTITPLLAPFDSFYYVKTNNPDPSDIRFIDKNSKYYTENMTNYSSIIPTSTRFLDVQYENQKTGRVAGGYIFKRDGGFMDGGVLTLQQKKIIKNQYGYVMSAEYQDTSKTVTCAEVKDAYQYLIDTYTDNTMTFFEKMDAIQAGLDKLAVYPRGVSDTSKRNPYTPYPFLTTSVYKELDINVWFSIYEDSEESLFIDHLYPYVWDSISCPGAMRIVAKRIDPTCTVVWGSVHFLVDVTKDGVTKSYGGAGDGGNVPIYSNVVEKLFTFDGSYNDYATNVTLERLANKRAEYGEISDAAMGQYQDRICGNTFYATVASGCWIRVLKEPLCSDQDSLKAYVYFTKINTRMAVPCEDVWVDGRYIGEYNFYEPGEKFSDHPTANIIIRNMVYYDIGGIECQEDVFYKYDLSTDTWRAESSYLHENYLADKDKELPEKFVLTREEALQMNLDENTDAEPAGGFIYDGSVEPGTPF